MLSRKVHDKKVGNATETRVPTQTRVMKTFQCYYSKP